MSATSERMSRSLAAAAALEIDERRLRDVVERLSAIGSSPLGFRVTGTPEDAEAARLAADELRAAGLSDVATEPVAVDGWRFDHASVAICDAPGAEFDAASMGGVPQTRPKGVTGRLVHVRTGTRAELDRLDLDRAIVLFDWTRHHPGPADVGLEIGLRGAVGMIVFCPPGGPFYQAPGALGSFNGGWYPQAPPMVTVTTDDGAELARRAAADAGTEVRLVLRATLRRGTRGSNVVGYLPGRRRGAPIVVGAHHDGWFRAAFDNASGVAVMLAIARALSAAGHTPQHTICFTSRTAEEYGSSDSAFDWCTGAWRQVTETHREWRGRSPFALCVEASGHPALRTVVEAPVELRRWAGAAARRADAAGWLTSGWYLSPPVTGTEQWPLLINGVPGLAAYSWEKSFAKTAYHTPLDTPDIVDFAHLARVARFYALLLIDADADPDAIFDHRARARHLARAAREQGPAGAALLMAAERHAGASGRRPFTAIGRRLHAVSAAGVTGYPHAQAAKDVAALERALAALAAGDTRTAVRQLERVGNNSLCRFLSAEAMAHHAHRRRPGHPGASWGAASHLTQSPVLSHELASLRGEPGSRRTGPWLEASLQRHLRRMSADLHRRLDEMAQHMPTIA
jgi:hypothetical protein